MTRDNQRRCIGIWVVLLLCQMSALGDTITVNFDDPSLTGASGDSLVFTGTISNETSLTVYLNGGSVDLASPFDANTDVSIDLLSWPFSVDPMGTTSEFQFFTVSIPNGLAGTGAFPGVFVVQGGADLNAFDDLNDPSNAGFDVNIASAVPEPNFLPLISVVSVVALLCPLKRHRTSRVKHA